MIIEKDRILEVLRGRGQHARADWVNRELPDHVDTEHNAGLLATLRVNPDDLLNPPDLADPPP